MQLKLSPRGSYFRDGGSNGKAKHIDHAENGVILPMHRTHRIVWVVPVTRTGRVHTCSVLLHQAASHCNKLQEWSELWSNAGLTSDWLTSVFVGLVQLVQVCDWGGCNWGGPDSCHLVGEGLFSYCIVNAFVDDRTDFINWKSLLDSTKFNPLVLFRGKI